MTQGRLEGGGCEIQCCCCTAERLLKPAEAALVICKQVTMQARCMSICSNEQGRKLGRERGSQRGGDEIRGVGGVRVRGE